jgi:hypothetical protein
MQLILRKGQSFQSSINTEKDSRCMIYDKGYRMYPPHSPLRKGGIKGGFLCIIALFLFLSCSSEKQKEVKAPEPSEPVSRLTSETPKILPSVPPVIDAMLEISPPEAFPNTIFYLIPKNFDPAKSKVEWLINGMSVSGTTSVQFKASQAKKGDVVQAKATIGGYEILSNPVKIKNSKPEFKRIKIMPEVFKPGDTLYVEVSGTDIDGDEVTILYEWTKNGEPAGRDKRIEVPIKRGDKIDIKIIPFDGEDYGHPIILHREIRNIPPMIIENIEFNFDGNTYTYQVKAEDPDGDTLAFSLKSSPEGMEIDPSTGLIRWEVLPETRGKHNITFSVTDGHGGEAIQSFTFEITPEQRQIIK